MPNDTRRHLPTPRRYPVAAVAAVVKVVMVIRITIISIDVILPQRPDDRIRPRRRRRRRRLPAGRREG